MRFFEKTLHVHKYLKSIIYGGLDGIITTFAIVAGVAGAGLSASIVLILGFANLIADGISMGIGDYLSTKAQNELEDKRKTKKVSNKIPLKNSWATFLAFVIFGFIPLLAYILDFLSPNNFDPFTLSIILTAIALFSLGIFKNKITKRNAFKSGIETLVIGGIAAVAAYLIGFFISGIV